MGESGRRDFRRLVAPGRSRRGPARPRRTGASRPSPRSRRPSSPRSPGGRPGACPARRRPRPAAAPAARAGPRGDDLAVRCAPARAPVTTGRPGTACCHARRRQPGATRTSPRAARCAPRNPPVTQDYPLSAGRGRALRLVLAEQSGHPGQEQRGQCRRRSADRIHEHRFPVCFRAPRHFPFAGGITWRTTRSQLA